MTDLLLSKVAGGTGTSLYMPQSSYILNTAVGIKTLAGTLANASAAAFWTAIDLTHTPLGYETVKLAAANDTTEQTIMDVTDAGVLTHVVAPAIGGSGTVTIRVTIDGSVNTFISETMAATGRFCLGYFSPGTGQASTSGTTGIGGNFDEGFSITSEQVLMPPPPTSLSQAPIGMIFSASCKVTVQGSAALTATANELNGCANYLLGVPEGLS